MALINFNPLTGKFDLAGSGGSQTPWTSTIDADENDLERLGSLRFGASSTYNLYYFTDGNGQSGLQLFDNATSRTALLYATTRADGSGVSSGDILKADGSGNYYASPEQDLTGLVPYAGATQSVELGANRLIIGGGTDDTTNDLQLNGSGSIIFGTQITQGLSGNIFNFNNPAFAQANAELNLWTQTDGTTAASDGDVLTWDDANSRWAAAAPSGGGGGVTTMGAFGSSPNGDGGTISGVTLTLQPADATNPGGVSTTTQSFLGTKTFLNTINYFNSSATSNTVFDGAILNNATAATANNQQYSPALRYIGQGWKTNATAASQTVEFRNYLVPVQGAANPTANLITSYAVNGGAFSTVMTQTSAGQNLGVSGSASAPTWGFSAQTNYGMYHASSWLRLAANGLDSIGITSLGLVHIGILGIDSAALGVGNDKSSGYYVMRVRAHSSQSAEVIRFETSGAAERAHLSSGYFWRVQDGSAATPAYSFLSDTGTGIYRIGASNLGIATGGSLRLDISNSVVRGLDGSAATPGWGFINDTNTGFYRVGADQIGVSCGNSQTMIFTNTQNLSVVGSAAAPGYSFNGDSNTGFYRSASDVLNVTTGGTSRLDWSTTAETFADGFNITFGTTTGTKIGTATTQKIGFYNATPIVQGASVADATGGVVVDAEARTAINALISRIEALGLIATV